MINFFDLLTVFNKLDQARDPQAVLALLKTAKSFAALDPAKIMMSADLFKIYSDMVNVLGYLDKRSRDLGFSLDDLCKNLSKEEAQNGK